ncbi:MotA/TolQ/ExbB proton channel family protein [Ruficoccus amylovorans]|uniref:MotA/TolQ/ExbB proton channel family protein n=1 Tax=Ruficoccus amylovorans TaxID=1804625 RepID=A0A842HG19_9BACT|nr:MotA/TolQ/ExbB proton channel family protein [Ruficoccus amylovorans]MBC2594211.1 MotA/TolQ/ExbB proton channel family protein [Ruficoccus amylovorans]
MNLPTAWLLLAQVEEPTIFTYFGESNVAGKAIVIALVVFSLIAWTVMIGKYLDLSRLRSLNLSFESRLAQSKGLLKLNLGRKSEALGPYAVLVESAVDAFHRYEGAGSERSLRVRMGHVENALQRGVAQQTIKYESKMILLGSIVTGAPFLGLLGTVWGVMDAFGSMALQASATLQNLAPGVSGALLTTVAGLLVAIPSVFGYNFLLTQCKLLITELENFASSLADRIELEVEVALEQDAASDEDERPSSPRPGSGF